MRWTIIGLAFLIAIAAPGWTTWRGQARAASFDCAKASAPTDVAICSNPTLSDEDGRLGAIYAKALARDPSLRQVERAWLAARDAGCGHDVACLQRFITAWAVVLVTGGPSAKALPTSEGACATAAISKLGSRLDGMPDSGSAASESDGAVQVSYEVLPAVVASRVGDQVIVCLVSLPTHCPPGDDRGKIYAVGDLRTLKAWSAADSEHMCGGA